MEIVVEEGHRADILIDLRYIKPSLDPGFEHIIIFHLMCILTRHFLLYQHKGTYKLCTIFYNTHIHVHQAIIVMYSLQIKIKRFKQAWSIAM